ncbi:MAG: SMP-30/gluconolactonase/LRE family protein [Acidobacteriota bacterium]
MTGLFLAGFLCIAGTGAAAAAPPPVGTVETLVLFDASVPETPESIVFDRRDNAYITLALTGEIRRIAPDGTVTSVAFLPIEAPCATPAVALGLAIDRRDRLFVAISSCNPANQGVFEVDPETGSYFLVAQAPPATVWNGIDVTRRWIYAADTFDGKVWRMPKNGGIAEIWSEDPLLARPAGSPFPGPNGLKVFRREIYVANSSTGDIVAIPRRRGGIAGPGRVAATMPPGTGCDEFTFDIRGRIYCTTDPTNLVVRLDPRDGSQEILLTADDLLDGPTSAAFGRRGQNRKNLYITNAAFPIFTTTFRPSLMRLRVDTPGAPE